MAASFFTGRAACRGAQQRELRRRLSVAGISPTIGRRKKTPLARGCRSLACVEERLLVVIWCARCPASCFCSGPGISSVLALARLLPKGAAAPLMPGYEQHPCQEPRTLKRCDMLRRGGCRNVTQRTICGVFRRSKHGAWYAAQIFNPLQNSQSVKELDAFRGACFSAARPGESQVVEFV